MPTIGRVIQGGPMIRIREDGETVQEQLRRAKKEELCARQRGDVQLAESWEMIASGPLRGGRCDGLDRQLGAR